MYKLLIVDDEMKIREVIKEYAEFNGYEVAEAEDGMEAVRLCKDNDYDLIILDIMMPKLDGFSTCKEIKKFKPDIPVIMLSARGEEYDKLFGFELGIDDYVVKPFSPKELMARVNAVLARRNATKEKTADILKFQGLEISPDLKAQIVERDLWVSPGDHVSQFEGANNAIGTLVLRFENAQDLESAITSQKDWLKVKLN